MWAGKIKTHSSHLWSHLRVELSCTPGRVNLPERVPLVQLFSCANVVICKQAATFFLLSAALRSRRSLPALPVCLSSMAISPLLRCPLYSYLLEQWPVKWRKRRQCSSLLELQATAAAAVHLFSSINSRLLSPHYHYHHFTYSFPTAKPRSTEESKGTETQTNREKERADDVFSNVWNQQQLSWHCWK